MTKVKDDYSLTISQLDLQINKMKKSKDDNTDSVESSNLKLIDDNLKQATELEFLTDQVANLQRNLSDLTDQSNF